MLGKTACGLAAKRDGGLASRTIPLHETLTTHPQLSYGVSRYQLAVVELDSLEVVARREMLECRVGDERTVVQFEDGKTLGCTAPGR